jgi:hypothetical protein
MNFAALSQKLRVKTNQFKDGFGVLRFSLYSSECVVVSTYFFMAFIKKQSYRRVHVARLPQFQIFSLAQSPDSLSGSLLAYS